MEEEDEFRDADDGTGTAPPPSPSPASTPSKSKPAAGLGRRLLASIGLPTSLSAAIGRSAAPSSIKPPAPQPPVGPNLGLGLLLHQGPNPSAEGSLVPDTSARGLHLTPTADLQKRHQEMRGEQGAAEGGEDQVIGHDAGVGEELAVLVPEEEDQDKKDVADGCSGNRDGYSAQDLDKEGEQYKCDELEPAMEDQEVMEEDRATKYYNAVEDQSNNDTEQCTGDAPTEIKDDKAVEEKEEAMEQGCAVGILGIAEDGVAGGLQGEDGLVDGQCKDVISVQDQHKVVEQCWNDELGVTMGDSWVHDIEEVVVGNEGVADDQSNNAALEQYLSDELGVIKDGNVVEDKEKVVEQKGAICVLDAAEDGTAIGLRKEDVVVDDQGEDVVSVHNQDKVVEQCVIDELGVPMGDSVVHGPEVVEQVGVIEYFGAAVDDQNNNAALEQRPSDDLGVIKDDNVVEDKYKVLEQKGAICILGAAEDGIANGLRKEDVVVEDQGEEDVSVHDQDKVVEQRMSDELGVPMGYSLVHDQEVAVLDQHGVTGRFDAAVEDKSNNCAVVQCTSELEAAKDDNFVEEKEKAVVEGAIDIVASAKDDTLGLQEEEVVAEKGEDVISLQDQYKAAVEQEGAICVRVATVDDVAIDAQEKAVEQSTGDESSATKGTEEEVVDQVLNQKQDATKGGGALEPQEGEDVTVKEESGDRISVRDQDKVAEQGTSDQWRTTVDDNAAEDQEVRREKIRLSVVYPQRPGRSNCRVYMSTGSCPYGLSCYSNHPQVSSLQLKTHREVPNFPSEQGNREVTQILELNRVGLPIRENAKNCMYYMRNGTCGYGKRCCYNHPEHVLDVQVYKPTGWDDTNFPSSPHSKKSSSPHSKESSEHANLDDIASCSEILPPNILRMLLPPQTVPPGTEAKEMKVKKDPNWSSASDDSDGCCSADSSGGPLCKQEHHVYYPERPGRQECPFFLKYGNCKIASACNYHHPNDTYARSYRRKDPSLSEKLMVYPDKPGEPECPFYMKTGTCKFGAECKFHHPKDLPRSTQGLTIPKRPIDDKELRPGTKTTLQDHMDQQQNYPERPGQPECRYYMQFGTCKFLSACIFHHPKDRVPAMPECPFYMKTGSCQFGSACEFYHPRHRSSSKGGENDDGTEHGYDYPQRPGEHECFHYMKHGYCKFQMNCKYHHPTDRLSRK